MREEPIVNADGQSRLKSSKFWRRSLTADMLIGQAIVVALCAVVLVSLGYFFLSQKTNQAQEEKSQEYISFLQQNLALPIWNFDEENISNISKSIIQNDLVSGLEVMDNNAPKAFESFDKWDGKYCKRRL